jgi:hypothetical protein
MVKILILVLILTCKHPFIVYLSLLVSLLRLCNIRFSGRIEWTLIIGLSFLLSFMQNTYYVLQVGRLQDLLHVSVTLGLGQDLSVELLFYPFNLVWCKSSSPSDRGWLSLLLLMWLATANWAVIKILQLFMQQMYLLKWRNFLLSKSLLMPLALYRWLNCCPFIPWVSFFHSFMHCLDAEFSEYR